VLGTTLSLAVALVLAAAAPQSPGKYLLLDARTVAHTENARLAVGTVEKDPRNPLFVEDQPWEVRFDNLYGNVLYDKEDGRYKIWYSPFIVDRSAKGMTLEKRARRYAPPKDREMGLCYATSRDGLTWEKPALGLARYKGSTENNIVLRGPHGTGIFKDLHEPDPKRRFKALFQGLAVRFSSDGLHWCPPSQCEGVSVAGDTHNNAFWAPTLGQYVGMTRTWGERGRQVARIESRDFVHWTEAKVVLEGLDKDQQTYAMPTFFYGGVYLGLVAIHEQSTDRVWTELAWSADTKEWHRVDAGTPLIPCAKEKLAYDYGCVYACAYPIFLEDEIRLYYGGSDWLHTSWRNGALCLARLRPDGFAGYEQATNAKPAMITTAPVPYNGQAIQVTTDVPEGGSLKVTILDADGNERSAARAITETVTDGALVLDRKLEENPIRLQFELDQAKLYSFTLAGRDG